MKRLTNLIYKKKKTLKKTLKMLHILNLKRKESEMVGWVSR